ncbi:MAG TPA: DNA methyltransferase [Candidatus Limnocylindrales bacterium]|nr:DNA methyltransferase [Candidatus Limnocylindrales bacterium]
MTFAEFKKKWSRYQGKETSAYQSHFDDLCRLLDQKTPNEADPSGTDFFCFQKRVVKDAELLEIETPDASEPAERGFADVWKKGCFAWEYKGKKKNLDEAYKQLLRYRESLLNPPLLVVCDFDRYIVKTNFNGTVQEVHEFTNAEIDRPENLRILRALFTDPEFLKPQRTTAQVTEKVAAQIAAVAKSLQSRESVELADAKSRKEVNVAQKKNLRIARFLNRIVFCLFAEDTGLLPKNLFTEILKSSLPEPVHFSEAVESLFRVMARGGLFGKDKIRCFNGHLFEDSTVFELTEAEIKKLAEAAEADWQFIQPSIMGTLFQRALDESHRAQLGAHYTSEPDIRDLVEPVLMAPLRREWAVLKATFLASLKRGKGTAEERSRIQKFLKKLRAIIVLDPACGSGNFLYVSLQLLLSLEKEVITFAEQLGFRFEPEVSVQQLRAIEINSYAFELAQVSVQIGYLQWRRENGFDNDRTPVLQNLDGFENKDALLRESFRKAPKNLKEAQAEEHEAIVPLGTNQVEFQGAGEQKELGHKLRNPKENVVKVYNERAWPECDVIVGNPPFLGNKRLRSELGDDYTKAVFEIYGNRLPATSDFCCYWFEKARELIAEGKCQRAGLLATTSSKQISSRRAFERIRETGRIFFAISDRDWFDAGTAIRICMVGFGSADTTEQPTLDGKEVTKINADLSTGLDTTGKQYLRANEPLCFMGTTKVGDFDIPQAQAVKMLSAVNPHGKPNSDVLRPFRNGSDLVQAASERWIVDFGVGTPIESASLYAEPFKHVVEFVKPERVKNNRKTRSQHWWLLGETLPAFRKAIDGLPRYIGTARVAKHRLFVWQDSPVLPDSKVIAIAFADDFRFGVLHSRFHEVWTLAMCGWHGIGNDATYNPTECFQTFPFPFADDLAEPPENLEARLNAAKHYAHIVLREDPVPYHTGSSGRESAHSSSLARGRSRLTSAATKEEHRAAIAAAAQELNALRERWLNPPEWTVKKILEFPGSADGAWARYVVQPDKNGVGTVRYPRLGSRDADCAAKLKDRTLTKLYNERPAWLDLAHKKLDAAVAAAYGFPADLTDEQILEKLLALNLARAAEEAKAAKVKKPKTTREKNTDEMI